MSRLAHKGLKNRAKTVKIVIYAPKNPPYAKIAWQYALEYRFRIFKLVSMNQGLTHSCGTLFVKIKINSFI